MAKKHSPGLVERCSLAHSKEVISNEKGGEGLIDSCVLRPPVKPGFDIVSLLHLSHRQLWLSLFLHFIILDLRTTWNIIDSYQQAAASESIRPYDAVEGSSAYVLTVGEVYIDECQEDKCNGEGSSSVVMFIKDYAEMIIVMVKVQQPLLLVMRMLVNLKAVSD